jgi:hypothetical protein
MVQGVDPYNRCGWGLYLQYKGHEANRLYTPPTNINIHPYIP